MSTIAAGNVGPHHAAPDYHAKGSDQLDRLAKIEGQVRGISRMIEQDRYCVDGLTQIGAMTKALQQVGLHLLDEHIRHCVVDAVEQGGDIAEQRFTERRRRLGVPALGLGLRAPHRATGALAPPRDASRTGHGERHQAAGPSTVLA